MTIATAKSHIKESSCIKGKGEGANRSPLHFIGIVIIIMKLQHKH